MEDERNRLVVMNGSRANPNEPHDIFQDYDFVYIVRDVTPFIDDIGWIHCFGELMLLQMPEDIIVPQSQRPPAIS